MGKIEGMVEVFQVIEFDPVTNREAANEIYNLYQSMITDRYCQPYVGLQRRIEMSILPIIEVVEAGAGR